MKRSTLTAVLSAIAACSMAQNRLPGAPATWSEASENSYEIHLTPHMYHIQHKKNIKNNEPELRYPDGTSAYGCDTDDKEIVFPKEEIYRIFKNAFSQSELFLLGKERISIGFVVSPEGYVCEVDFWMKNPTKPLLDIPLERFAQIEKGLKELKLKVGSITRQLQFNWVSFTVFFAELPPDLPPLKPDPRAVEPD